MKKKKVSTEDLSDLDIEKLPGGFTIIFDLDRPVGAIITYEYYQYLSKLLSTVKDYVHRNKNK
jgi:hypothetical protein